jgi:hypothetical protein
MSPHDPRFDPENAPVFSDDAYPSFAKRTVSTILTLAIIAVAVVFFMGWMSRGTPPAVTALPPPVTAAPASVNTAGSIDLNTAAENAVEPATGVEEPRGNAVYNFFHTLLSPDETDPIPAADYSAVASPHPLTYYTELPGSNGADQVMPRQGIVLDYEGRVAGNVQAVLYADNRAQFIYFALDPELSSTRQPGIFGLPYNAARIAEDKGALNIQLTPEQTAALANQAVPPQEE